MGVILKGKSGKQYIFEGPYKMRAHLFNEPGVFAYMCKNGKGTNIKFINSAEKVYDSVLENEKLELSFRQSNIDLSYAVFYFTNEDVHSREQIIKDIKEYYDLMIE